MYAIKNNYFTRESMSLKTEDVYLLYPFNTSKQQRYPLKDFFKQAFTDIDQKLVDQPVFYEAEYALRFARYASGRYIVIKARIPEHAIEANATRLTVRPGVIQKSMLLEAYPAWQTTVEPAMEFSYTVD